MRITFYECEHGGDVDHYEADLRRSGARIIDSDLNEDAESCTIEFEVTDKAAFKASFANTDAFGFSSWCP